MRIFWIINNLVGLIFNLLSMVGIINFVFVFNKLGFTVGQGFVSVIQLIFLYYFLGAIGYFIIVKYLKGKKITTKVKKQSGELLLLLSFILSTTFFPIWFYSSPTGLSVIGQFIFLPIYILVGTLMLALLIGMFLEVSNRY